MGDVRGDDESGGLDRLRRKMVPVGEGKDGGFVVDIVLLAVGVVGVWIK
jgi:hypothetical protein